MSPTTFVDTLVGAPGAVGLWLLIALSTYVLFVASVPDETVSTPCILPVPPRVISPP